MKWKKKNRFLRLGMYLNAMFEAVMFPAGISDLDTGLTDVDRNTLSHLLGRGIQIQIQMLPKTSSPSSFLFL